MNRATCTIRAFKFKLKYLRTVSPFIVLFVSACGAATPVEWVHYTFGGRLSIQYPSDWYSVSLTDERIDIISAKDRASGVVIQQSQAEIIVKMIVPTPKGGMQELMKSSLMYDVVLSRQDVPVNNPGGKNGCDSLIEIVSQEEMGPGAFIVNSNYLCDIRGRYVVTQLRNWLGDQNQVKFQETALRIARSIQMLD